MYLFDITIIRPEKLTYQPVIHLNPGKIMEFVIRAGPGIEIPNISHNTTFHVGRLYMRLLISINDMTTQGIVKNNIQIELLPRNLVDKTAICRGKEDWQHNTDQHPRFFRLRSDR